MHRSVGPHCIHHVPDKINLDRLKPNYTWVHTHCSPQPLNKYLLMICVISPCKHGKVVLENKDEMRNFWEQNAVNICAGRTRMKTMCSEKEPRAFPQGGRLERLQWREVKTEQLKAQTLRCALTIPDDAVMNYFSKNWRQPFTYLMLLIVGTENSKNFQNLTETRHQKDYCYILSSVGHDYSVRFGNILRILPLNPYPQTFYLHPTP